jgi:F-type H+-transporting ATPase subunit gamma
MPAQLRTLRRRVRSVRSMRKITKAQELIATSRIAKAQGRVAAARPYSRAITGVLTALASSSNIEHPLLVPRERVRRAGVLVVTSDRGMCGGYNANVIRTAEQLIARLRGDGIEPVLYVIGRKGVIYYRFRDRDIAESWTGFSEQPAFSDAREAGSTLIDAFTGGADDPDGGTGPDGILGIDELFVAYTQFKSMVSQVPTVVRVAPMEIEESSEPSTGIPPAYEFEPDPDSLLDALLPKYINTRIYAALLDAAAAESAARRTAMKNASDNADDIARTLTRQMNAARQAAITQEISEIVGGVDALAASGSEE